MVDEPFVETMRFKAPTNATVPRTLAEHFEEPLNVKNFGAVGDGWRSDIGEIPTDDTAAIQRCFDTAWGGPTAVTVDAEGNTIPWASTTPHGKNNAHLNRSVFIPAGYYNVNTLQIRNLYGATLFGSGLATTYLTPRTESLPIVVANGMANCHFYDLSFGGIGGSTGAAGVPAFDLNWDGNPQSYGAAGLRDNLFSSFGLGYPNMIGTGIRIAHSGFEGHGQKFFENTGGGSPLFLIEGPNADGIHISGGGLGGRTIVKCTGGSFMIEASAMDDSSIEFGFDISSGKPCYIEGIRTEQKYRYPVTAAPGHVPPIAAQTESDPVIVKLVGGYCRISTASGSASTVSSGGVPDVPISGPIRHVANVSGGGTIIIDGCTFGAADVIATSGCRVYVRGCFMPAFDAAAGSLPGGVLKQHI